MQKFLFLLLSLILLGPLGIDLYLPTIPAIAKGLNSSESLIQSTIALFILVLGIGQLIAGPLVDKYGRKPIAIIGIVLYMLGAAMAALAVDPVMFVSSRLLQGVSVCCTAVVAFSGVRDRLSGNEAARAFGFLNGTLNIVPALAPLLGGFTGRSLWLAGTVLVPGIIRITGFSLNHYVLTRNPPGEYSTNKWPANKKLPAYFA